MRRALLSTSLGAGAERGRCRARDANGERNVHVHDGSERYCGPCGYSDRDAAGRGWFHAGNATRDTACAATVAAAGDWDDCVARRHGGHGLLRHIGGFGRRWHVHLVAASCTQPRDLMIAANGRLCGTPQSMGMCAFTLRVTDKSGDVATKTFHLFVIPKLLPAYDRVVQVNGQVFSLSPSMVYNQTTYMGIWYVQQVLTELGITTTWNGHTWGLSCRVWSERLRKGLESFQGSTKGRTGWVRPLRWHPN